MPQIKDIIQDVRLPATAKNLLHRLRDTKELTLPQFLQECAYWALKDGFDELRPRQFPQMPDKAIELENMPLPARLKLDYYKLYAEFPQIKEYYEQRIFIINYNKGVFEWLKEIKLYIPQDDELSHRKINERIFEFKAFGDELSLTAEKVKEIFEAQEV